MVLDRGSVVIGGERARLKGEHLIKSKRARKAQH